MITQPKHRHWLSLHIVSGARLLNLGFFWLVERCQPWKTFCLRMVWRYLQLLNVISNIRNFCQPQSYRILIAHILKEKLHFFQRWVNIKMSFLYHRGNRWCFKMHFSGFCSKGCGAWISAMVPLTKYFEDWAWSLWFLPRMVHSFSLSSLFHEPAPNYFLLMTVKSEAVLLFLEILLILSGLPGCNF